MVVHEFIMAHFGGHIGPVSRPYQTTFEAISDHFGKFPENGSATAVEAAAVDDVMVADTMLYKDHFY